MNKISGDPLESDSLYRRGSVIPYVFSKGAIFYAFSIDSDMGVIADFGGGREGFDKDIFHTAIREYKEESYSVFGNLTRESIVDKGYTYISHNDMLSILFPVEGILDLFDPINKFNERVIHDNDPETSGIIWLSRSQLMTILDNQDLRIDLDDDLEKNNFRPFKMYDRLRIFLNANRIYL